MTLQFPQSRMVALHELGARLIDSRRPGTDLQVVARELLAGFFDICLRNGLDGLLVELELDVASWSSLADHPRLLPALVAQLDTIALDGGGPRNVKPRQLADSVVTALGLTVFEPPDRTLTLAADLRPQVLAALASVVDVELAVPQIRETIVAAARERLELRYVSPFNRTVAQLDERGMQLIKQPNIPLDASQVIQRALVDARAALVDRVSRTAIDRAKPVIARADAEAAARIDAPITLRLTPRDVAILRVSDARVAKTPAAVVHALFETLSELAQLAWRAPEQPVRRYAASQTFVVGDLIDHPKFGRGTVVSAAQRIEVEFADGKLTLVHVPPRK